MEESDLLRERLQAITEKHRVQEDIRQKKQELDQEKLKLQHLKKKALREQWLLQDSVSHDATVLPQQQSLLADQQQTRVLQLNIYRIEKEVECLEREESMISTNESFILNRLKAVEKRPEEIIKEAQDSLTPEPSQVATVIPHVPECLSSLANKHPEPPTSRKILFAMEINVTKNMLTGESTVVSTAAVPPQDLHQRAGVKVYDDGRKCVYALTSQEGSQEQGPLPELSANEVEQLLRSATEHRQVNQQVHRRGRGHWRSNHQDERDEGQCFHLRHHRGTLCGDPLLRNNMAEEDVSQRKNWQDKQDEWHPHNDRERYYSNRRERSYHGHLTGGRHYRNDKREGHHSGPRRDRHCSSCQDTNGLSTQTEKRANYHANGVIRNSSGTNGARANGCPPPISYDPEVVSACQPELCYTPANHIPLRDYISVEEEELYCCNPRPHHTYSRAGNNQSNSLYGGPAQSDRVPSPICCDDTAFTILDTMETTEPITAVFMGFQTTQDESGRGQEYEGSLRAELVIIDDDDDDDDDDNRVNEKTTQLDGDHGYSAGNVANGNGGHVDAVKDGQVGPGSSEIRKKHNLCCTIC